MKTIFLALLLVAPVLADPAARTAPAELKHPQVGEQVTFFYYKTADVPAAAQFYGGTLGFKKTFDIGTAKLFQITPHSFVGVIDENGKSFHKAPSTPPAVMLSIETDDLDAWYARAKAQGAVFLREPPAAMQNINPADKTAKTTMRGMMLRDPGGYTVEIFHWKINP